MGLQYLEQCAHPQLRPNEQTRSGVSEEYKSAKPIVPEKVADQIKLWEQERNRMTLEEAVVLDGFGSEMEFHQVRALTAKHNVMRWCSEEQRKLIVTRQGLELVKKFKESGGLRASA